MNQPLVSVVTPFHNTAQYLPQCIESVLAQSYKHFEYILVDNCSTDGAGHIAESYARQDSRIRVVHRTELLTQVQNYNAALAEISADSKYCKIVQADDYIFPECLDLMTQTFELSPKIGLVSSYWLKGSTVCGVCLPEQVKVLPGVETARLYLEEGSYLFGSPTTVMYRSFLIHSQKPFYNETLLHEDTEKCMQILRESDFGFVHHVLSCLRLSNESISSRVASLCPRALDWYIISQRYAPVFLEEGPARALKRKSRQQYYSVLANQALRFRRRNFWDYQSAGLRTLGESLDWPYLLLRIGFELLYMATHPGMTTARLKRRIFRKTGSNAVQSTAGAESRDRT